MQRRLLNSLFDSSWEDVTRLCSEVIPPGSDERAHRAAIDAVLQYKPRKGEEWVTGLLRKQIPLAARLAAVAEIPEGPFLTELSRAYAEWSVQAVDAGVAETLQDFPAGPVRAEIGRALIRLLVHGGDKTWDGPRRLPTMALMQLAPTELSEDIEALLRHKDKFVRYHACPLMSYLGIDTAIPRLMKMFEKDKDMHVRAQAATELAKMQFDPALPLMIRAIESRDTYKALLARHALLAYGSPEALEALVAAMEKNPMLTPWRGPDLSLVGTGERIKRLKQLLASGCDADRWTAAELLGALRAMNATEALVGALGDAYENVRKAACYALARIGAREAIPNLVERLDDSDSGVRVAAVGALAELEAKEALEPLVALLRRRNTMYEEMSYDCGEAAEALAAIGCREAIQPLIKALRDERVYVRALAAKALGRLRAKEAIRPLKRALKDEERGVAAAAARALGKLGAREAAPSINEVFKSGAETGSLLEGHFEILWLLSSAPRRRASRG